MCMHMCVSVTDDIIALAYWSKWIQPPRLQHMISRKIDEMAHQSEKCLHWLGVIAEMSELRDYLQVFCLVSKNSLQRLFTQTWSPREHTFKPLNCLYSCKRATWAGHTQCCSHLDPCPVWHLVKSSYCSDKDTILYWPWLRKTASYYTSSREQSQNRTACAGNWTCLLLYPFTPRQTSPHQLISLDYWDF